MAIKKPNHIKAVVMCLVLGAMISLSLASTALAADPPNLLGTYLGTGEALAAGNVYNNSTFKLNFSSNVTVETYWAANQGAISLRDSANNVIASTITRVGTGLNTDPERANVYLAPNAPMTVGQTYTIRIEPTVTANNGLTVGGATGGLPILVTFTVSATPGESIITNHLTVDSYLTVGFGVSDLYYAVSSLADSPSANTTISVQSNAAWTRTVSWTALTGVAHGAVIPAASLSGASDLNGSLTAAGPNAFTGTATADYLETLTFTFGGAAGNPQADTYTGTITVAVAPAL